MQFETEITIPVTVDFEIDPGQELITAPNDQAQEGIEPTIEDMIVLLKRSGLILYLDVLGIEIEEQLQKECWQHANGLKEQADEAKAKERAESHDRHW